jgi:hypothetical protein
MRAAVRLVTQVEARMRARGIATEQSPVRADHAIALSVRGQLFCTVSAVDGGVYVGGIGRAPLQRVPLVWDDQIALHLANDDGAGPDPIHAIERLIAALLRAAIS